MWSDEKINAEIKKVAFDSAGQLQLTAFQTEQLLKRMRSDHNKIVQSVEQRLVQVREQLVDIELWELRVEHGEGS
jgi:hypothetical protein